MAFLDFLNSGIGGMQQAQGPNMSGGAGVGAPQPIGPTYGQLGNAIVQYGSKPGSSAPMVSGALNRAYGQASLLPLDPNAPAQQKALAGQGGGEDNDTLAQVAKYLMAIFGGV